MVGEPQTPLLLHNQTEIYQSIRENLHDLPHIFLTGPSGSGKTTCLLDILEILKRESPFTTDSVLFLSSEKDRGIHTIRDKVHDFCKRAHSKPNSLRYIVIDDADTLPLISQQALRRPMEQYAHLTRFLFASRHASHLIEPLRSRCLTIELEPLSPYDAITLFMKDLDLRPPPEDSEELFSFCVRNFTSLHEIKCCLKLYKALLEENVKGVDCFNQLKQLLPSSKVHTNLLLHAFVTKDYDKIHTAITQLFLHGYLLDDILLSIEQSIQIFPSTVPETRFLILQFTMLGWISIQQGKEGWLDTIDILDQVFRG